MRELTDLIDTHEPAIELIRQWLSEAELPCELLPPSSRRGEVLAKTQVTTRSPLGALAYDTGGLQIEHGWLRILGSGHEAIPRDLASWNETRCNGLYLVADDAVGGFYAINGGLLGPDLRNIYYWPPDDLEWMNLGCGFSQFLQWAVSSQQTRFYSDLRWPGWETEIAALPVDHCLSFYPPLWAEEGSIESSLRTAVPIHEAYDGKVELVRKLTGQQ